MSITAVRRKQSQRRLVICFAAITLFVLVAAAVIFRQPLHVQYLLHRLRQEPARFEEYLFHSSESRQEAARQFLKERPGREQLFRLYLEEYDRIQYTEGVGKILHRQSQTRLAYGAAAIWQHGFALMLANPEGGYRSSSMGLPAEDPERRAVIFDLLHTCVGETFRVASYDGFEFQLQVIRDGYAPDPQWPRDDGRPRKWWPRGGMSSLRGKNQNQYVCYFRLPKRYFNES